MMVCMSPEQISAVVQILTKARTDKQVKLRFGFRQRVQLVEAIRNNSVDKDSYRYRWISEARNNVIKTLGESADKFNKEHTHDAISVQDFMDVIESVLLVLRASNS